ncbi:MAG: flagellar motor protein MotB [Pseudomonadota bacterium]|nr:flagellar motor protein MotB [Pseudomonadota bacterium]
MEKPGRGHYSEPETEGESEWLATFADLSTLLLCFFVLLFSISSIDNKKFRSIMSEVRVSLGNAVPMTALEQEEVKDGGDAVVNLLSKQKTVATELEDIINDEKLSSSTVVDMGDEGALLRIGGKVMFESGSVEINSRVFSALDKIIIMALKNPEYHIDIKGHTDNIPISAGKFLSNWELSALRATTVLRYLLDNGLGAERLTATGYADTQPLVSNLTSENRARNRRVEFLFKKMVKKGNDQG